MTGKSRWPLAFEKRPFDKRGSGSCRRGSSSSAPMSICEPMYEKVSSSPAGMSRSARSTKTPGPATGIESTAALWAY